MSARLFQAGDRVRPRPGTSDGAEGDGTVTGTAPTSWRPGDHMVHVVHDNGTTTSWDSSDLELLGVPGDTPRTFDKNALVRLHDGSYALIETWAIRASDSTWSGYYLAGIAETIDELAPGKQTGENWRKVYAYEIARYIRQYDDAASAPPPDASPAHAFTADPDGENCREVWTAQTGIAVDEPEPGPTAEVARRLEPADAAGSVGGTAVEVEKLYGVPASIVAISAPTDALTKLAAARRPRNTSTRLPDPSIHAEAIASAARATAELAGKEAIDVAWNGRARAVAEGRDEDAAVYLEALAVLGAPGAVVAAVLDVDPDAVPNKVLVDAVRAGRRGSDGGAA